MPCQNESTHAQTDGLGKDKVDAQPTTETKVSEEKGDDGVEHRGQGEGRQKPFLVQSEFHSWFHAPYYPNACLPLQPNWHSEKRISNVEQGISNDEVKFLPRAESLTLTVYCILLTSYCAHAQSSMIFSKVCSPARSTPANPPPGFPHALAR